MEDTKTVIETKNMRIGIRAMLAAMDLTNKEASEVFDVNASAIGYMTDTKKVKPFYDKVLAKYEEFKATND